MSRAVGAGAACALFLVLAATPTLAQEANCRGAGQPEDVVNALLEKSRAEIREFRGGGGKAEDENHPALHWAEVFWQCRAAYAGSEAAAEATAEAIHILIHAAHAGRALELADSVPAEDRAWGKLVDFLGEAAAETKDYRGCIRRLGRLLRQWRDPKLRARAQLALAHAHTRLDEREQAAAWFETVLREAPGTPYADRAAGGLQQLRGLKPGQPAPLFEAKARDGSQVALAAYRGRAVVLIFWAST